ncbi:hypothetical protein N7519_010636 [Penicillium mononematosum]|uniref:uncharacterized protein n=1 Tax=Penicillium mononematosum TaxID=268346 RepID=UPI002547B6CC|nr:uncharacterized protein N7519_010636 [Penicillium mononematosum]KAJ6180175.1 hypothetical protein N7519_010636 [Penicillium mononematosum]
MPLSLAKPPCDCLARTAEALDRFPNFSTKSPPDIHYIPMDGVLIMGAGLVEHWELLNGCETDTHLDAKMMQTMIDAVTKTLTLYEAALELILGSWSQTQEPNGGGIDRSDNLSSTHERSSNSSVDTKPTVIVTEVTVYLGRLELGRGGIRDSGARGFASCYHAIGGDAA